MFAFQGGSLKKNPVKYFGGGVNDDKDELIELGINVICRKGSLNDYPNQDDYFIFIDPHTRIYSVFDGHGKVNQLFFILKEIEFLFLGKVFHVGIYFINHFLKDLMDILFRLWRLRFL
jgi:hypothetical protein